MDLLGLRRPNWLHFFMDGPFAAGVGLNRRGELSQWVATLDHRPGEGRAVLQRPTADRHFSCLLRQSAFKEMHGEPRWQFMGRP